MRNRLRAKGSTVFATRQIPGVVYTAKTETAVAKLDTPRRSKTIDDKTALETTKTEENSASWKTRDENNSHLPTIRSIWTYNGYPGGCAMPALRARIRNSPASASGIVVGKLEK